MEQPDQNHSDDVETQRGECPPIDETIRVDTDEGLIIFGDGTEAGVDSDYDCGVLPEGTVRHQSLSEVDAALAILMGDDSNAYVTTWLIETDPLVRTYDLEPLEGIALHTRGKGHLARS